MKNLLVFRKNSLVRTLIIHSGLLLAFIFIGSVSSVKAQTEIPDRANAIRNFEKTEKKFKELDEYNEKSKEKGRSYEPPSIGGRGRIVELEPLQ